MLSVVYAECRVSFIVMLSIVMQSVVMLSVVMLSDVMLSALASTTACILHSHKYFSTDLNVELSQGKLKGMSGQIEVLLMISIIPKFYNPKVRITRHYNKVLESSYFTYFNKCCYFSNKVLL